MSLSGQMGSPAVAQAALSPQRLSPPERRRPRGRGPGGQLIVFQAQQYQLSMGPLYLQLCGFDPSVAT